MVTRRGGTRRPQQQGLSQRGNPETREFLLDVAERLLAAESICDMTVGEVTREAGLAQGTFYIYFQDRFDLLKQLIQRRTLRIFDRALEHVPHELRTLDRLTFTISAILESWQQYSGVMRSLYQLSVQREDFLELQQQLRAPFAERMSAELEQSIVRDHARPIDVRIAVDALATMLSWCCMSWFGLGIKPYPEATVEQLASHVALLWYRALFGRDPSDAGTAALPPELLQQADGLEYLGAAVPSASSTRSQAPDEAGANQK
jgi:AcrR family transcriptional regulator